jgi:hypothetical protein
MPSSLALLPVRASTLLADMSRPATAVEGVLPASMPSSSASLPVGNQVQVPAVAPSNGVIAPLPSPDPVPNIRAETSAANQLLVPTAALATGVNTRAETVIDAVIATASETAVLNVVTNEVVPPALEGGTTGVIVAESNTVINVVVPPVLQGDAFGAIQSAQMLGWEDKFTDLDKNQLHSVNLPIADFLPAVKLNCSINCEFCHKRADISCLLNRGSNMEKVFSDPNNISEITFLRLHDLRCHQSDQASYCFAGYSLLEFPEIDDFIEDAEEVQKITLSPSIYRTWSTFTHDKSTNSLTAIIVYVDPSVVRTVTWLYKKRVLPASTGSQVELDGMSISSSSGEETIAVDDPVVLDLRSSLLPKIIEQITSSSNRCTIVTKGGTENGAGGVNVWQHEAYLIAGHSLVEAMMNCSDYLVKYAEREHTPECVRPTLAMFGATVYNTLLRMSINSLTREYTLAVNPSGEPCQDLDLLPDLFSLRVVLGKLTLEEELTECMFCLEKLERFSSRCFYQCGCNTTINKTGMTHASCIVSHLLSHDWFVDVEMSRVPLHLLGKSMYCPFCRDQVKGEFKIALPHLRQEQICLHVSDHLIRPLFVEEDLPERPQVQDFVIERYGDTCSLISGRILEYCPNERQNINQLQSLQNGEPVRENLPPSPFGRVDTDRVARVDNAIDISSDDDSDSDIADYNSSGLGSTRRNTQTVENRSQHVVVDTSDNRSGQAVENMATRTISQDTRANGSASTGLDDPTDETLPHSRLRYVGGGWVTYDDGFGLPLPSLEIQTLRNAFGNYRDVTEWTEHLNQPLSTREKTDVERAFNSFNLRRTAQLKIPVTSYRRLREVNQSDGLDTIRYWLDDILLNQYMILLSKRDEAQCAGNRKCYFMDPLASKELMEWFRNGCTRALGNFAKRFRHRLRGNAMEGSNPESILYTRYLPTTNFEDLDLVILPIKVGAHFVLGVIDVQHRACFALNTQANAQSLEHSSRVSLALYNFIVWFYTEPTSFEQFQRLKWRWYGTQINAVPIQGNQHDCGVLVLMMANLLSVGVPLSFLSPENGNIYRKRIANQILVDVVE